MDYPYEPQDPPFSPLFYNTYGFRNNTTGNGNYVISPRIGFNYNLPDDANGLKTQMRGGAGLFVGSFPVVWYRELVQQRRPAEHHHRRQHVPVDRPRQPSRAPREPLRFTGHSNPPLTNFVAPSSAVPSFDVIDPKFEAPSNWKENIAIDRDLPFWHLILTADVDLMQVNKDAKIYQKTTSWRHPGRRYMPDGAIRYDGQHPTSESASTFGGAYSQYRMRGGYTRADLHGQLPVQWFDEHELVRPAGNPATGPVY